MRSNPSTIFGRIHFGNGLQDELAFTGSNPGWLTALFLLGYHLPYSRYPDYESSYYVMFLSVRGSTVTLKSHYFPKIQCCFMLFFLVLMLVGYIICPLSTVPWVMCKIELPTWAWWCGHTHLEEFSFKRKAAVYLESDQQLDALLSKNESTSSRAWCARSLRKWGMWRDMSCLVRHLSRGHDKRTCMQPHGKT